jgi:putative acetyltransferase
MFKLTTVTLKDGRKVVIRKYKTEDKMKLVTMYESLSEEALLWALPPYTRERIERGWLSNLENLLIIVALSGDRVVGHAQVFKFPHQRRKGTADLLIYLHQDFHNVGLGTIMLAKLVELARKEKMHRIGLHVVTENRPAVRLYEKMGFRVEGTMRDSYLGKDGKYHDEFAMGLILQ